MDKMKKIITAALAVILTVWSVQAQTRLVSNLAEGKTQTLCVYGTSVCSNPGGRLWVGKVAQTLNSSYGDRLTCFNCGRSGRNSSWALENLADSVIARKPDAEIIEFATNDAVTRFNISPEKSLSNMEKIISGIKSELPECEIILMICTGFPIEKALESRPDIWAYNDVYTSLAKKHGLTLIDLAHHYKALGENLTTEQFIEFTKDGVHPSRKSCITVFAPGVLRALTGDKKYKIK